ncbi:MAG: alpha-1,2-fucosyltransferase [Eubacteriales bacterium]|nr:alpha-1,2-fucosyltransferase [Eubacteriales bacterium]
MFVVCFGDGLGNQMFQYAFYKALKVAYPNNNIKMDIFHIYGGHIHNGFELNSVFGIPIDECDHRTALLLSDYCPYQEKRYWFMNKMYGIRRYLFGLKESFITQDDPTCYYDEVFHLSELKSYILKGNWVNEKYFANCREELIKDFTFPEIVYGANKHYKEEILKSNSISVHIRKGDYINSGMINLPVEYYKQAKKIIEEKVSTPKYFIFTDDKHAISEYLEVFKEYIIVEGNSGNQSYRDMQLMSLCKHNIIPNSTFSFWGAYLNSNPNKIVIAPNKSKLDFRHPFALKEWTTIPFNGKNDSKYFER